MRGNCMAHHEICGVEPERRKTVRGRECPGLALLAGAHTDICLERASLYVTVAVSLQEVKARKLKCTFLGNIQLYLKMYLKL
jgi:hypothetical protein